MATPSESKLPAKSRGLPNLWQGLGYKQRKFLRGYTQAGTIRGAMTASGVDTRWHYHWLSTSNDYSVAFARAKDMFSDVAEGAIIGRGIHGYEKPLSYRGMLTGDTVREYSDALALAVIKALKPEYRDGNQIAIGPAKISIEITQSSEKPVDEIVIKSE